MKKAGRGVLASVVGLALVVQLAGCSGVPAYEYIAGETGEVALLRDTASVRVVTPAVDLSITGGTQVEVNWQAFATSRFAVLNVIIDEDQNPDNGNEITAYSQLPLTEAKALVDTTRLLQGTYYIGVILEEVGETVAHGYAPGRVTIDQRPALFFNSPRHNFVFDRSRRINPPFEVNWELDDPDSVNTVEILLDPDQEPNGNEVSLFRGESQGQDAFTFDLPTAAFEPGTYRLLALVSDGQNSFPFYAPASIRLRARLSGDVDLRDMHLPTSGVQGAVFEGFNPRDNAGSFVSTAQDIDGDGFDEIMLVAQFGKPGYVINRQRTGVGEGYLIYGRPQRFSGVVNLNSTGTLFRGDIYGGVPEVADPIRPSRGITSFAVLSDWDGDNVREFAFGLPFTDSVGISWLDLDGYFRTGGVVIAASSSLGNFEGQNVHNLAEFGTVPVPTDETCDPDVCIYGFVGLKAPAPRYFYREASAIVPNARLGCRISTVGFGDQCGESVAAYPFYGGFT